jgi:hypothetical protein
MAKKQVVMYSYTCDVCGNAIPEGESGDATRKVSWDGGDYVVDVCVVHASRLGDILGELKGFVDAGSRAGAKRGRRPAASSSTPAPRAPRAKRATAAASTPSGAPKRGDLGTVRSWARENGFQVSERGRIPAALLTAYDAANGSSAPAPEPEAAAATPTPRKRRPRKAAAAAAAG